MERFHYLECLHTKHTQLYKGKSDEKIKNNSMNSHIFPNSQGGQAIFISFRGIMNRKRMVVLPLFFGV